MALTLALLAAVAPVAAEELDAVKARMGARLGEVAALVASGKAGESRTGYLAARGALQPAEQRVMEAENKDRRQVYAAIGAKTGAPAEQVGAQRAQAIARQARSGTWLQDGAGKWYRKP
jgi:uncharacterized protein YdbL (DUF1318 family)